MKKSAYTLLSLFLASLGAGSSYAQTQDDFILLKSGSFMMGSDESVEWRGIDEKLHKAEVQGFYMSPYEVTQKLYTEITGSNPSHFKGEDLPVENISWLDAVNFCNSLSIKKGLTPVYAVNGSEVVWDRSADGYRLPTESEWEYACRAGTDTLYNTEHSISADEANYCGHYPYNIEPNYFSPENMETGPGEYRSHTLPIGQFSPNCWGLYDMHGNVAEWVFDSYNSEQYESEPKAGETVFKIYKGGAWNDFAKHIRSAYRGILPPEHSRMTIGLRLVRNADKMTGKTVTRINQDRAISGKKLVLFYSWSGNTRRMAQIIAAKTGADIIELELEKPYSGNYSELLVQAWKAQLQKDIPALRTSIPNFESYETIFIGYPLWWASIPRPIATLLQKNDFTGKNIVVFSSGGGGHLQQSLSDLMKLARSSHYGKALEVSYSGGKELTGKIDNWLKENKVL